MAGNSASVNKSVWFAACKNKERTSPPGLENIKPDNFNKISTGLV